MTGIEVLQIPGGLGGMELAVILLIAILLFGANKIPKLARSTGQAMGEFKRGREEIEEELSEIEDATTIETGDDGGASATGTTTTEETTTTQETTTAESGSTDESKNET